MSPLITRRSSFATFGAAGGLLLFGSCSRQKTAGESGGQAYVGARILADPAGSAIEDGVLLVRNGRVEHVGSKKDVAVPAGAETFDFSGKTIIPGLICGHTHISDVNGIKPREYTVENTLRQLGVFARYGITTVLSLGGEKQPAFQLRDEQDVETLDRARIYVAGDVITGSNPAEAREMVTRVAEMKPDWIKIRVDDNLGTGRKMSPDVYQAVINQAHGMDLRVATHIFYLDDAKALLRAGSDMIAHSVRDKEIDQEFIDLMKERNVPYCPTFTREISTFVYETKPDFFSDPFFRQEADPEVVKQLENETSQAKYRQSKQAAGYKEGLKVAQRNLKLAADAGLLILMGTDSGATADRFEGFFEHLEMQMMVEAGMTPAAVLRSATTDAAKVLQKDQLGILSRGSWADFLVLDKNPLEDIRATRSIREIRIAGNKVKM